jgi:hypothetical protein
MEERFMNDGQAEMLISCSILKIQSSLQKAFLHLKTLKYAPKYLKIPSQVMEIVIFNKGLFQNLGTYLYPRIFWGT